MSDDFLSGLVQSEARIGDIEFRKPFVMRDSRLLSAAFTAPVQSLRELLPDDRLVPAQIFPGRGLIQLDVFEHRDTDIGPFNEFLVFTTLKSPHFSNIPTYNYFRGLASHELHLFFLHFGATSDAASRVFGEHLSFPESFTASMEFSDSDTWLTCEVKENADLIVRLRARKIPAKRCDINRLFYYTSRSAGPKRANLNFKQYGMSMKSSDGELTLGSTHPIARELSATLTSNKPRICLYVPTFQAIVYGSEGSP